MSLRPVTSEVAGSSSVVPASAAIWAFSRFSSWLMRDRSLRASLPSSDDRVLVQPLSNIASMEADTRLDLEMWNHVALCVAIDRFGVDRKDRCEFTGCHQPFRAFQEMSAGISRRSGCTSSQCHGGPVSPKKLMAAREATASSDNWAEGARPESDLHYTFCARMKFEMMRQPQNGDIGKHILTQSVLSVLLSVLSSEQAENGRQ